MRISLANLLDYPGMAWKQADSYQTAFAKILPGA